MSLPVKDLEAGSLYITIAVPKPPSAHFDPAAAHLNYPLSLPPDFDPTTYETWCADTLDREEFDWGLYWHRGRGDGTFYGLRPIAHPVGAEYSRIPPPDFPCAKYTLVRRDMRQSPRLLAHVAGLVRVLHAPGPVARDLTSYLDWLAANAAATATRSFIWATTLYLRTRRHLVAGQHQGHEGGVPVEFDITGFLGEALHFAYGELSHGLGGQLPRPVMVSAHGMDLTCKGAGKGEKKRLNQQRRG